MIIEDAGTLISQAIQTGTFCRIGRLPRNSCFAAEKNFLIERFQLLSAISCGDL